jgi:hypothetical protein
MKNIILFLFILLFCGCSSIYEPEDTITINFSNDDCYFIYYYLPLPISQKVFDSIIEVKLYLGKEESDGSIFWYSTRSVNYYYNHGRLMIDKTDLLYYANIKYVELIRK